MVELGRRRRDERQHDRVVARERHGLATDHKAAARGEARIGGVGPASSASISARDWSTDSPAIRQRSTPSRQMPG